MMTPDEISELRKTYNATVASIKLPNEDLMILRVRPDAGVQPHRAGQYSTLGMGHWEPRAPGCQAGQGARGAARAGWPGGGPQAGRGEEADPPGVFDHFLVSR